MSDEPREFISEEQAREIWRRAVELQMDAARREQTAALPSGHSDDETSASGLSLESVRSAAVEAGIQEEFIAVALAEQSAAISTEKGLTGWKDRSATRALGTDQRTLEVVERVNISPAEFLEGLREVAPRPPYLLQLKDTIGDDPMDGAVLIFQIPGMAEASSNGFSWAMATVDIKQMHLSFRGVDGDASTEVRITAPLKRSRRMNWIGSNALGGLSGVGIGGIGLAIATASGAALPLAMGIMAAGVISGVRGTMWGVGRMYRLGLVKAEREFRGIVRAARVAVRLGADFIPRRGDKPSGDAGDTILLGM